MVLRYSFFILLLFPSIAFSRKETLKAPSKWPMTLGLHLNVANFTASKIIQGSSWIGNPDLSLNYFISPHQSIGTGLDGYFTTATLNIWSLRINYHHYFYGDGYAKQSVNKDFVIEQKSKSSWYWGGELRRYSYFITNEQEKNLSINDENIENNGTYYNICAKLGYERRYNSKYALHGEISQGLLALAASDDRVSSIGTIILFGVLITL